MTDDKLEKKFNAVNNFIILNILFTLILVFIVSTIGSEIDKISAELKIFQKAVQVDPVRKKRIDAELNGNFNDFEIVEEGK